ncbi:peroxisomal and mitochondrial division factor 2-like [Arachis duranensis]|uniref:Peroxisomal and mitochondrial division factor 2-like n=1 Tax=Arachis duranensis TaxID=130453 RepID=A0A6P4C5P5_ARADU|nr:peroxisomal and mitochondrial division factor 2-like [Arachis duranensis]
MGMVVGVGMCMVGMDAVGMHMVVDMGVVLAKVVIFAKVVIVVEVVALARHARRVANDHRNCQYTSPCTSRMVDSCQYVDFHNYDRVGVIKKELEQSRDATKAASAIAARAAELETELARLQHDSISDMKVAEETMAEAAALRKLLLEMESKVKLLEREVEFLKKDKSKSEEKIRDLEKKIGALEKKDVDERNKWTRVEEELREKIQEMEKKVLKLGQKTKEVESFANSKRSDMEEWIKEKLSLQEALKKFKEREKSLELFVARLKVEAGVVENVIRGLNQKVDTVNGVVNGDGVIARVEKGVKGLNVQWPVVVAGSTVVAATVVIWFYFWLIHENNNNDGFFTA